jgi:hypothetical protein
MKRNPFTGKGEPRTNGNLHKVEIILAQMARVLANYANLPAQ